MQINKRFIIYVLVLLMALVVVIFAVFIFQNKKQEDKIWQETVLYYDDEGIPARDTVLFEWGGWQNIPSLESLTSLVSKQNGGFINKIAMYRNVQESKYFTKIEILGDYEIISLYFLYSNNTGWVNEQKDTIPKKIRTALDEKLQTPPDEQVTPIINE